MNVYQIQIVYEYSSGEPSWLVNLTDQQEAEMLARTSGWAHASEMSFTELDMAKARVPLPFTGTVKGFFVLYHE